MLFTDKTGTLTEGRISFMRSVGDLGKADNGPLLLGLLCTEAIVADGHAVGGNPLDRALWESPAVDGCQDAISGYRRLDTIPFDHERCLVSVLVEDTGGTRTAISKGAPENVLARCTAVPSEARAALDAEFAAGNRVVAVASKPGGAAQTLSPDDEQHLQFRGLLVFLDPPKASAKSALDRLSGLGVTVKVVTGDNAAVAAKVCADLGLPVSRVVTGQELDGVADAELPALIAQTTVFARVTPEDKAKIVRAQRATGVDVAFLGDGVNDALALHAADVGISVDSATDVACYLTLIEAGKRWFYRAAITPSPARRHIRGRAAAPPGSALPRKCPKQSNERISRRKQTPYRRWSRWIGSLEGCLRSPRPRPCHRHPAGP